MRTPRRQPAPQLDLFAVPKEEPPRHDPERRMVVSKELADSIATDVERNQGKPGQSWSAAFEHVKDARQEPEKPAVFKPHSFDFTDPPVPDPLTHDGRPAHVVVHHDRSAGIPFLVGMLAAGGNAMCKPCVGRLRPAGEYSPPELHAGPGGGFVVMLFNPTGELEHKAYKCMACGTGFEAACPAKSIDRSEQRRRLGT